MSRVTALRYLRAAKRLALTFDDGYSAELSAEFLRVHSPSAEVRGHGHEPPALVTGKSNVTITTITPVGHYAIQLGFDDGHDSGLYTWRYLRTLAENHAQLWQQYLDRVISTGKSRDADVQVLTFEP